MKIIFFGLGSIGRKHVDILLSDFNHELYALRSQKGAQSAPAGIKELYSWDEVKEASPDVAFITNPTSLHVETAQQCALLGMHLFIEKPIGNTLDGVDELEDTCARKNLACYVAYVLRFHPVVIKMKELLEDKEVHHVRVVCSSYLPSWREGQDYVENYSTKEKYGGGVLLDLSHEFDYIQHLFGSISDIKSNFEHISNLSIDVEDFADVLLTLQSGAYVNLHLNFLSHLKERTIKVDFEGGYCLGDLNANTIKYCSNGNVDQFSYDVDRKDILKRQIEHFLSDLGKPQLISNFTDAKKTLEHILTIKDSDKNSRFATNTYS